MYFSLMNVLEALEYEIVSSTRQRLMTRQLKDPRYTWGIVVMAFRAECPWELESDTAIEMRERNSLLITFLMLSMKMKGPEEAVLETRSAGILQMQRGNEHR